MNAGGKQQVERLKEEAEKEFDRLVRKVRTQVNVKTDQEFNNFLASQGIVLEEWRRQNEREFIYMQYLNYRIQPILAHELSHDRIEEYYKKHSEDFQVADSVVWQDIFIDATRYRNQAEALAFAQSLVTRVQSGKEDFAKLAAQDFNCGPGRLANGEGQESRRGQIQPAELEPILFGLHDGQIGRIVEMPNGYHVVRLVKRQYAGILPLDEKVQAQIRQKIRGEVFQREAKMIVEELRRQTAIEIARSSN